MPAMLGKVLKRGVSAATVALLCVVPSTGSVNRRANTRFHTDQELPKPCEAPEQLLPSTRQNSRVRTAAYIATRANIVHSPDFESGCVRVLKGNGARSPRRRNGLFVLFSKWTVPRTTMVKKSRRTRLCSGSRSGAVLKHKKSVLPRRQHPRHLKQCCA